MARAVARLRRREEAHTSRIPTSTAECTHLGELEPHGRVERVAAIGTVQIDPAYAAIRHRDLQHGEAVEVRERRWRGGHFAAERSASEGGSETQKETQSERGFTPVKSAARYM